MDWQPARKGEVVIWGGGGGGCKCRAESGVRNMPGLEQVQKQQVKPSEGCGLLIAEQLGKRSSLHTQTLYVNEMAQTPKICKWANFLQQKVIESRRSQRHWLAVFGACKC